MPGCGNSDLSEKLLTKLEIKDLKVLSVDYEESVVKKMEENKPKDLELSYVKGDVTNLDTIKDQEYHFSIDKGTLDAIAVDDKEGTVTMCNAYFKEMVRVLTSTGELLIVSLLQPHVLKILLDYFIKGGNVSNLFTIKIQQIENITGYAEKDFIKYFVSIKKYPIDTSNEKMV